MKAYLYFILVFLSEGLAFLNIFDYADNSFDLLRIMYLEKTSLEEFSFNPLFIMLSYTFNVILSVSYITSNSLRSGSSLILSRFDSSRRCLVFIFADTLKSVIFCSLVESAIPALLSIVVSGMSNIAGLMMRFLFRQTVLLSYGSLIALLIGKKLTGTAANVIGALFILLLVTADFIMPCALALADLSTDDRITTAAETFFFFGVVRYILLLLRKMQRQT